MTDVLVVGGGTSGSVVASRLSEDPDRHVTLVEAGPDDSAYDERVRDPRRAIELFGGGGVAEPFSMDGISMVRGRGVGGTSAVNFLAAVRGKPADYDRWNLPGWSYAELVPFFERAETQLGVRPWDGLSRVAEAFRDGVPGAEVLSAARHPNGERRTVSQAYLTPEVRARPNLEIRVDSPVRSLDELDAPEVIVCCGATRTPGLLQRSGIECGDDLQDHLGVAVDYWEASDPYRMLGPQRVGDVPEPATAPLISYGHQAGTCAMGTVLDHECRVFGAEHVRVVDASSLPRLVAAPSYLTCVALVERVAALMS